MKLDIKNFSDKDSKKPEYRALYEENDFIKAYGLHTDKRIEKDGPELAIGAKKDGQQDWDIHGQRQLDFLISRGLMPHNKLLDFGCGTGRLACKAIPYLNAGNYYGIDISTKAIRYAIKYISDNGLMTQCPYFTGGSGTLKGLPKVRYDFIWSHSVFTHIPMEVVQNIFSELRETDFGEYYFTYKESAKPQRSGLKQFQYSVQSLKDAAFNFGLTCEPFPYEWPAGQKTMVLSK